MSGGRWGYQSWRIKDQAETIAKFIEAIEENTAAREALTEQLRPIDYSGHVPDQEAPDAESVDQQFASTREAFASAQAELMNNLVQIIYELGRLRGILEERDRQEAAR